MEAHVIGFDMWVKAVEKAKSTDPDKVIDALPGIEAPNLTGGIVQDAAQPPHHQAGVHRRDARATASSTWCGRPTGSSPAMPGRRSWKAPRIWSADWVDKKCGNFNTKTNKCGS